MKITNKTDYSIKVILELAKHYPTRPIQIEEIAKRREIPKKYLEQLMLMLKKGGFIQSKKGPGGGYYLSCEPDEIMLGDIIRFMEGPLYPVYCVDPAEKRKCDFESTCVFTSVWKKIEEAIAGIVDKIDFADLSKKEDGLRKKIVVDYQI